MQSSSDDEKPVWGQEAVLAAYALVRTFVIYRLGWQIGEDVAQDVALAICEGICGTRARTESEFRGWCYGIARHKINSALRSIKYRNLVHPMDPAELLKLIEAGTTDFSTSVQSDVDFLIALLRESKFPCNEVLVLAFVLGVEDAEIAEAYGISEDAARMKVFRCRKEASLRIKKHF